MGTELYSSSKVVGSFLFFFFFNKIKPNIPSIYTKLTHELNSRVRIEEIDRVISLPFEMRKIRGKFSWLVRVGSLMSRGH